MSAFEYSALDARGPHQRGVAEGDTARQVRQQLRDRGWIPTAVHEVAERRAGAGARRGIGRAGASSGEVALLTRQLATLIGAGTPLEEALRAVARQSEKPRVRNLVTGIRARVVEGHTLADGLRLYEKAFPELYCATVAAGEHTGRLDLVLERLADFTERRQHLRQRVLQALIYPIALVLVSLAVIVALLTFVVPQVTRVFQDMGQTLPGLTRGLIAISDFLVAYGVVLGIVAAAAVTAFTLALRRIGFRRRVHALLLRVPVVGRLIRGLNAARFARTLSILAGSGVPVLEALRIAAAVIENVPMREAVTDAAGRIREGTAIHAALERSGQFPPMMVNLVASGEGSGRLEEMLERAADSQEREVESLIGTVMAMFEPILIVTMGGMVLTIVLAILLPIFEMNQLVG